VRCQDMWYQGCGQPTWLIAMKEHNESRMKWERLLTSNLLASKSLFTWLLKRTKVQQSNHLLWCKVFKPKNINWWKKRSKACISAACKAAVAYAVKVLGPMHYESLGWKNNHKNVHMVHLPKSASKTSKHIKLYKSVDKQSFDLVQPFKNKPPILRWSVLALACCQNNNPCYCDHLSYNASTMKWCAQYDAWLPGLCWHFRHTTPRQAHIEMVSATHVYMRIPDLPDKYPFSRARRCLPYNIQVIPHIKGVSGCACNTDPSHCSLHKTTTLSKIFHSTQIVYPLVPIRSWIEQFPMICSCI
jgi:hypothetical protein